MSRDAEDADATWRARRFSVLRREEGLLAASVRMAGWATRQSARELLYRVSHLRPRVLTISHPDGEFEMLGDWSRTAGTGEERPEIGGLETPVTRELARVLAELPEPVFYDVGAATGYYARLACQYTDPANVHAFEGDAAGLRYLRQNNERYADGDMHVVPEFVGPDGVRLDEYAAATEAPDVVKVDVDGAEVDVLSTMDGLLADGARPYLVLEVHFWGDYAARVRAVREAAASHSYDLYLCLDHRDPDSTFQHVGADDLPGEPPAPLDDYMLFLVPAESPVGLA